MKNKFSHVLFTLFFLITVLVPLFSQETEVTKIFDEAKQTYINGDNNKTIELLQELIVKLKNNTPDTQTTFVRIEDFIQEYKTNQIRAEQKYLGKKILLSGVVESPRLLVDPRINDGENYGWVPSIVLNYIPFKENTGKATCYFTHIDKSEIAELNIGTKVVIEGVVYKSYFEYVSVVDCIIIKKDF